MSTKRETLFFRKYLGNRYLCKYLHIKFQRLAQNYTRRKTTFLLSNSSIYISLAPTCIPSSLSLFLSSSFFNVKIEHGKEERKNFFSFFFYFFFFFLILFFFIQFYFNLTPLLSPEWKKK